MKTLFIRYIEPVDSVATENLLMESFIDMYDFEFIVLKGHMLVEYTINLAIEKLAFQKAKTIVDMQFSTKLLIAEAFGIFEGSTGTGYLEQIRSLTKLRNGIAHKLDIEKEDLTNLIKYHPTIRAAIEQCGSKAQIGHYIYYIIPILYSYILHRLETKIAINNLCIEHLTDEEVNIQHSIETQLLKRHEDITAEIVQRLQSQM